MKLVKLSLVAALAAGSMSVLDAKPLEEAIKNVDVSGMLRYRFDQASWTHDFNNDDRNNNIGGYNTADNRPHRFRAFVGTKLDVGDGFKLFGQLMYNNDRNGGWATDTQQGLTTTKTEVVLKQAYLQYDLADAGVSVLFGKQQLNTIWTADFTGIAAKVLITPTQGLTIAAFGVDSFEGYTGDPDAFNVGALAGKAQASYFLSDQEIVDMEADATQGAGLAAANKLAAGRTALRSTLEGNIYSKNMYGAAVLANFAGLDAQVWGAYWDKVATLYAVNLKYTLGLGGGNNVGVKATYLGNSMNSDLKDDVKAILGADALGNGSLVDGRLFANFAGLDARVGGIFYGKKDKLNVNTLEDNSGPDLNIGREMMYVDGSRLVESMGRNTFGYVGVGYTLPGNVRIGVQGVFGQNVQAGGAKGGTDDLKDTRYEAVGEISWQVNRGLSFETFYSYLGSNAKDAVTNATDDGTETYSDRKGVKHTVRLQALYKF